MCSCRKQNVWPFASYISHKALWPMFVCSRSLLNVWSKTQSYYEKNNGVQFSIRIKIGINEWPLAIVVYIFLCVCEEKETGKSITII